MSIEALSTDQIQQIHEATLAILEGTGVWFKDSPEAAELFRSNGCRVDDGRVRIDRPLLTECLTRLPDRNDLKLCVTRLGFSEPLGLKQGESHVGLIGNTSARQPGVRAAVETAWGLHMGMAAGANLVNTGLLDSTLMLSLEHLVLVDEWVSQLNGAAAGAMVDSEHLALEVIREQGRPAGNFMAHEHTVAHMKEAVHYSDFTGRTAQSYEDWYETAHQKVRALLDKAPCTEDTLAIKERLAAVAARLQEDDRTWRKGADGWWQGYICGLDSQY